MDRRRWRQSIVSLFFLCMTGSVLSPAAVQAVYAEDLTDGTVLVSEIQQPEDSSQFSAETEKTDTTEQAAGESSGLESLPAQEMKESSLEDGLLTGEEMTAPELTDEEPEEGELSSEFQMPQEQSAGPVDPTGDARPQFEMAEVGNASEIFGGCDIYSGSNVEKEYYNQWSYPITSYFVPCADGTRMRVQAEAIDGILVEYYDASYNLKRTVKVAKELPIFGGFYEMGDFYYVLSGQANDQESDSVEVFRITKYTKNWARLGSCGLYGANTTLPFRAGSARMTSVGKYLLIRTCHQMYTSKSDGKRHQANVTIQVDTSNMTISDYLVAVSNRKLGYASHSFNQFILNDNGKIVAVDHGDAYPRSLVLMKYPGDAASGKIVPDGWGGVCSTTDVISFPGEIGDNYTGASVGGFEFSDSNYLIAGAYDAEWGYSRTRNVFVAAVPKTGGKTEINYFTNFAYSSGSSALTPHLVKTGNNSFILLWTVQTNGTYKVYYTKIDGAGHRVGDIYSLDGNLSDCVPTVCSGKLIWYTWQEEDKVFYEIDLTNLSNNRKISAKCGHQWFHKEEVINGELEQRCSVCGQPGEKIAVPSTLSILSWQNYSNAGGLKNTAPSGTLAMCAEEELLFKPIFTYSSSAALRTEDAVITFSDPAMVTELASPSKGYTLIRLKKAGKLGITIRSKYNPGASATFYVYVNNLEIGDIALAEKALYYSGQEIRPRIQKVWYWPNGSDALKEGVDYTVSYRNNVNAGTGEVIVSGIGKYCGTTSETFTIYALCLPPADSFILSSGTFVYDGTEKRPTAVIKKNNVTLQEGKDYVLSYRNNVMPGTAYITATGIGNYNGAVGQSFRILPIQATSCTINLAYETCSYNGKIRKPAVTVTAPDGKTVSKEDYSVEYSEGCMYPGTYFVTIHMNGSHGFDGSASKSFTITRADQTIALEDTVKRIDKKTVTLKAQITQGNKTGKFSYTSDNPSVATVTSWGKVTFNGIGTARITATTRATQNYNSASKTITVTVVPAPTAITKLQSQKSGWLNIQYRANRAADGYQIQYGTSGDMKGAKYAAVNNSAIRSYTRKDVQPGETYHVRVRTFNVVDGKRYYSNWSGIKSITVR